MGADKKYIKLYEETIDALLECNDESLARITRAILCECLNREHSKELEGAEKGLYKTALGQIHRDWELAEKNRQNGKKGGRPKANQDEPIETQIKPTITQTEPTESDGSPPDKPKEPSAIERRFIEFWAAYPKKVAKGAAFKAWKRLKPSQELTEKMIAAIQRQKASDQWTREGGRFIPNPATWLNAERWEDEIGGGNNAETVGNPREYSAEQYTEGFITDDD